jgi:hypothetical protein
MRLRPAATLSLLIALLAACALTLGLPGRATAASSPCWKRVIDDWLKDGTIDGTYKNSCYQAALKHVPEDLRDYSNIADAINAALQNALRPGAGGPNGGADDGSVTQGEKERELQGGPRRSIYRRAIDNLGTTSADSLPIPLLVLAGLGTVLLLSAGGLAAHKRLRARRPAPPES